MRVSRAIRASVSGLGVGYFAGLLAVVWLRLSSSDAGLLWNVVSPLKLAAWILTSAHGVPLVVRSAAGLSAPDAPGSVGGLGEILGGGEEVAFSFSVLLIPISILAIVGVTVAIVVRRSAPESARQVLMWSGVAAVVHGAALAVIAKLAAFHLGFQGTITPELGLGAAVGRVGFSIGYSPLVAFFVGAALGAGFVAAGGFSSLPIRTSLAPTTRVVLRGWMRGLGAAAGIIVAVLGLGGVVALVIGRAPAFGLFTLGGFLLWANAVATGIVFSHGASMAIALDAGPFTGWERMDLRHFGVGATSPALLAAALIPIVAGIVAGRFCRRRTDLSSAAIAVRFGVPWGLTLAVLSLLLRVRVLSSFSVGALDLGGGSAAFDPLMALVLGVGWGTATAFVGARTARSRLSVEGIHSALASLAAGSEAATTTWVCSQCEMSNALEDGFCVSCGAGRDEETGVPAKNNDEDG